MIDENLREIIKYCYLAHYSVSNDSFFANEHKNQLLKSLLSYDNNFDSLKFLNYNNEEFLAFIEKQLDAIYSRMTLK